ncbi:MAG: hypothetical protein LCH44_04985 [Bacteroidetes bacterium]|jgi:hypothetical protein|nr:hypothetical protein [Bacteroidota bacterium]MCB0605087.1 hypothetical protein [Saprospiraceae bacterium]MCO5277626.1 hypothetical protein [Saprospiraceae bacterium]
MKYILYFLSAFCGITLYIGCITMNAFPGVNKDGYQDSKKANLFTKSEILSLSEKDSSDTIRLLDYSQILQEMKSGKDMLIILSTANCSFSIANLENIQLLYDTLRQSFMDNTVIINLWENINLPLITDLKIKNKYNFPYYFIVDTLNNESYLTKRKQLYKELSIPDTLKDSMKPLQLFYSSKNNSFMKARGMQNVNDLIKLLNH